jgi:hypothetical protein
VVVEPVWIWTGIEAHMAIILASLPALKHFFHRTLKDSSISSRLKSMTRRHRESGYDRTGSQGNSEANEGTQEDYTNNKRSIHVVQEVRLEDFLNDKRYDVELAKSEDERDAKHEGSLVPPESRRA